MELRDGMPITVKYDMGAVRPFGFVAMVLLLGLMLIESTDLGRYASGVAVAYCAYLLDFLMVRSSVLVDESGVLVRNLFLERRFPWAAIRGFKAEMRVVVVDDSGGEYRCFAVQRPSYSRMRGTGSRVDRVVSELEARRAARVGRPSKSGAQQSARLVRLNVLEYIVAIVIPVLTVLIGTMVGRG